MTDTARMKAILVFVAALLFAAAPFWSGDFGGFDPARFPVPQEDPPVQPAGYAFSIWGLIYAWLVVSAAYGLFARAEDPGWDATRWPLLLSLAVGASWLAVAQASPLGALVLIWVMLLAALAALFAAPGRDAWLLEWPVAVYAGWLTAASWVSVGINGAGHGVAMGATGWAWVSVAALFVFGGVVQLRLGRVPGYGLAIAWALVAVAVQNWGSATTLALVAAAGAAGFAAAPFLVTRRDA